MNEREVVQGHKSNATLRSVGSLVLVGCVYACIVVVVVKVQRGASSPDFGKALQMRVWRGVKRVADEKREWWGDVALKAGTQYNRCRNVGI